ncbi:VanZ family protein [Peribacillus deserti]|uniref:VanZ family protein n=1 Tax=Peribacillus deserti TaxID=673318 RepID=A0ABS2QC98_9BACI|nr:VanZ family protein [Peribacillus deserti]MBM7690787.1 VanZ family protein [Peribacillus deserti]
MNGKLLLVILWGLFLGLHTWTDNLRALLTNQSITFTWVAKPDFISFFYLTDIALIHQYFIIVKLGHFFGFAIMDLLMFNLTRNHRNAVVVSVALAFLTEILQLYFGRDGRLYDVVIDCLGVWMVYILLKKLKR